MVKYSENDVSSLKPLLADDIFTSFSGQIKDRQKKKEKLGITILSIDEPEIIDVVLKKDNCSIKLEFKSQQVQTTKDSKDNVIEGNDNLILNITELWTFSKKISSKNPNWILEKLKKKINFFSFLFTLIITFSVSQVLAKNTIFNSLDERSLKSLSVNIINNCSSERFFRNLEKNYSYPKFGSKKEWKFFCKRLKNINQKILGDFLLKT